MNILFVCPGNSCRSQMAGEHCPVLPPVISKEYWPLNDPAGAAGTEEEIIAVFHATRDEVRERVAGQIVRLREESVA